MANKRQKAQVFGEENVSAETKNMGSITHFSMKFDCTTGNLFLVGGPSMV